METNKELDTAMHQLLNQAEQQNYKVVVGFVNRKAAEHFQSWLCGQGEQDYWLWMECREYEEDGDITATSFDYNYDALTVEGKCGRLDDC